MDPATISLILSGVSSAAGIFGASSRDSAARSAQRRQDRYNRRAWRMNKRSMKADYRYQKRGVGIQRQNEETLGAWKDATNLQDWQYSLKIQDHEYRSQMRQYAKSEQIYGQQLSFNNMAAAAAREAEYRRLEDATNEIAFQNQDVVIKAMEAEGAAAVKGQQGRSAAKSEQAVMASLGRNQAILAESLLSARGETQAALKKIAADKYGADIAAEAARMLRPERLPQPPKPLTTPRAIFQDPRRPKAFDFGPRPVSGAVASSMPGAIMEGVGSIASGIAGLATSGNKFNFSFGSNELSVNPFSRTGFGTNALGGL
ncbi:hypothetical protein S-CBP1_0034 [Synechococcus phage S-CBP1]|uniref:Internal virion protein n=1 Tax=Synechococcus phage S-CBP1 TaxID=1273711 RepID=A0A096VKF6_9CAUD|nr:hypothetical protein S-CBP1_0034 [Synechococcus phage S-CBP1]AGK86539.1 hypothetical protein S-CBP1_0034 [Synechococcus phage S-CBP1]